jgi:hypothetical protein
MRLNTTASTGTELVRRDELGLSLSDNIVVIDVNTDEPSPLVRTARAVTGFLRRVAQHVAAYAHSVISHINATYVRVANATTRVLRAHIVYRPRHASRRTWYGRQRSTSEYNRARRAQAKEDDLPRAPREFISWVENFIETLRYEQDVMHPRLRGEHFVCS